MPFTAAQITTGANYTLQTYTKNDPIDQVNTARTTLDLFMKGKEPVIFGNGYYNETVYYQNSSNYQNYFGADQVTYNERDPALQAPFQYYNHHDGFWFDEDRLAANGIILTDDKEAVASQAEKIQLVNLLKVSYTALKEGIQTALAQELLRDGSQDTKACPGLDLLVSTTPSSTTVGGIDANSSTYWRNNTNLGISTATAGNLVNQMEITWRACTRYGGMPPTAIRCGSSFLDAYRTDAGLTVNRTLMSQGRGDTALDASVSGVFFKGVPLIWDPVFDALDDLLGAITYPWKKRCYFLNEKNIKLRPMNGHWMVNRKPERLPDRYVHYFGMTSKYGMTTNKRNSQAVLSIS